MQHISEVKGLPVVGRFYWVSCILAPGIESPFGELRTKSPVWLPVIGPQHNDTEFLGVPDMHYHFDLRFFNQRLVQLLAIGECGARSVLRSVAGVEGILEGPVNRRLKCQRQMPLYPLEVERYDGHVEGFRVLAEFERAYSKERVTCGRCPHRGIPLNGLPNRKGIVTCPGHGLAWNLRTGEMASRRARC